MSYIAPDCITPSYNRSYWMLYIMLLPIAHVFTCSNANQLHASLWHLSQPHSFPLQLPYHKHSSSYKYKIILSYFHYSVYIWVWKMNSFNYNKKSHLITQWQQLDQGLAVAPALYATSSEKGKSSQTLGEALNLESTPQT